MNAQKYIEKRTVRNEMHHLFLLMATGLPEKGMVCQLQTLANPHLLSTVQSLACCCLSGHRHSAVAKGEDLTVLV